MIILPHRQIAMLRRVKKEHVWVAVAVACLVLSAIFVMRYRARADGSGSNVVNPTTALAGSTGNTYTFTFTAAESMPSGELSISVPAGWSAPQGTAGTAGYTTATATTAITASVLDAADSTTGWSAGTACASGLTVDTGTKHEGTGAIRCANGDQKNGNGWYKNIATQNWSAVTRIGFWIYTSSAIANTDLQFAYDSKSNLPNPTEELSFGATIPANTWTYVVVSPTKTRTTVASYGFRIHSVKNLDSVVVHVDDILLGPGQPSFSGRDMRVRLLSAAPSDTVVVTYGAGGGTSGAAAPATMGTSTFTTQTRTNDGGTLAPIPVSPTVTVGPGAAARFVMLDPADGTVGQPTTVTVHVQDAYGNLVTSYQNDVTLVTNGSATGGGLVDIVNGIGTKTISDIVAQSVHLSLSDTQGTGLNASSSQDVTFAAGPISQFAISHPGSMVAGTRAAYVVTRQDAFGNALTEGANTVFLYSTSTGHKGFYTVASGGSPVSSVIISAGNSAAEFWYEDDKAGTWDITASDNVSSPDGASGLKDAVDSLTVSAAPVSQFLLNDPGDITAGARAAYVVTRQDAFGNAVTTGTNTAYLFSTSTGHKVFYDAASGGNTLTSLSLGSGASTAAFWYEDDKAGTWDVTVSDKASAPDGNAGINDWSDSIVVSPGLVAAFLLNDPGDMTAHTRLGYTITRQDAFGNAVTAGTSTAHLFSTSTGHKAFYDAASGGSTISSVNISGGSTAHAWYEDDAPGTWTITVSDNATAPDGAAGIADGTDAVVVAAEPIVATRFIILDPTDGAVTSPVTVTIRAENNNGDVDTTYQADIALVVSGSATGGGIVDIVNGIGTAHVTDHTAETVHLSLNDTLGTGLVATSTQDVVFEAGPVSQFLLNDPGDVVAGARLAYTVTRKDSFGNATTGSASRVYLYSSSTGNADFFDAASGGSKVSFVEIPEGDSVAHVWYQDDKAGSWTITASDNASHPDAGAGIADGTDSVAVTVGALAKFTLNAPTDIVAGARAGYIITRTDAAGNPVMSGSLTAYLSSNSTGSKAFYDAAGGGAILSSTTFAEGSATASVWYQDDLAGTWTITAFDNASGPDGATGIADATDVLMVGAGPAAKLVLDDPGDMTAGTRLGYVVTRKDAFENLVVSGSNTVSLSSNSTGPKVFYDAASGGNTISSIAIPAGSSSVHVWYGDDAVGSWTVTATDAGSGLTSGTDAVMVRAAPIVATRFALAEPADGRAGGLPVLVTVRAVDDAGNVDTSFQRGVTLRASGSAVGDGLVTLANGVGTLSLSDAIAETVHLSLVDSQGTGLNVSATQDLVFSPHQGGVTVPPTPPETGEAAAVPALVVPTGKTGIQFVGVAAPNSSVSVIVQTADAPVLQQMTSGSDGQFLLSFLEASPSVQPYGVRVTDPEGRSSPVKVFALAAKEKTLTSIPVTVPPTLGLARAIVTKGGLLTVRGYAAPTETIEVSVDGSPAAHATTGSDGLYETQIETDGLVLGTHTVLAHAGIGGDSLRLSFVVSDILFPKTDFNGDGKVDVSDWSAFLAGYASGTHPEFDLNGDGKIDVLDFSIFIRTVNK